MNDTQTQTSPLRCRKPPIAQADTTVPGSVAGSEPHKILPGKTCLRGCAGYRDPPLPLGSPRASKAQVSRVHGFGIQHQLDQTLQPKQRALCRFHRRHQYRYLHAPRDLRSAARGHQRVRPASSRRKRAARQSSSKPFTRATSNSTVNSGTPVQKL